MKKLHEFGGCYEFRRIDTPNQWSDFLPCGADVAAQILLFAQSEMDSYVTGAYGNGENAEWNFRDDFAKLADGLHCGNYHIRLRKMIDGKSPMPSYRPIHPAVCAHEAAANEGKIGVNVFGNVVCLECGSKIGYCEEFGLSLPEAAIEFQKSGVWKDANTIVMGCLCGQDSTLGNWQVLSLPEIHRTNSPMATLTLAPDGDSSADARYDVFRYHTADNGPILIASNLTLGAARAELIMGLLELRRVRGRHTDDYAVYFNPPMRVEFFSRLSTWGIAYYVERSPEAAPDAAPTHCPLCGNCDQLYEADDRSIFCHVHDWGYPTMADIENLPSVELDRRVAILRSHLPAANLYPVGYYRLKEEADRQYAEWINSADGIQCAARLASAFVDSSADVEAAPADDSSAVGDLPDYQIGVCPHCQHEEAHWIAGQIAGRVGEIETLTCLHCRSVYVWNADDTLGAPISADVEAAPADYFGRRIDPSCEEKYGSHCLGYRGYGIHSCGRCAAAFSDSPDHWQPIRAAAGFDTTYALAIHLNLAPSADYPAPAGDSSADDSPEEAAPAAARQYDRLLHIIVELRQTRERCQMRGDNMGAYELGAAIFALSEIVEEMDR